MISRLLKPFCFRRTSTHPLVYSYGITILDWSWHPVFLIKLRSLANGHVSVNHPGSQNLAGLTGCSPISAKNSSLTRERNVQLNSRVFNKVVRGLLTADAADEWVLLDTRVSTFEHLAGCRRLGNVTLFDPVLKRSFIFHRGNRSTRSS